MACCRLCLSETSGIYVSLITGKRLCAVIDRVFPAKISQTLRRTDSPGLPEQVCSACILTMVDFCKFSLKMESNQELLYRRGADKSKKTAPTDILPGDDAEQNAEIPLSCRNSKKGDIGMAAVKNEPKAMDNTLDEELNHAQLPSNMLDSLMNHSTLRVLVENVDVKIEAHSDDDDIPIQDHRRNEGSEIKLANHSLKPSTHVQPPKQTANPTHDTPNRTKSLKREYKTISGLDDSCKIVYDDLLIKYVPSKETPFGQRKGHHGNDNDMPPIKVAKTGPASESTENHPFNRHQSSNSSSTVQPASQGRAFVSSYRQGLGRCETTHPAEALDATASGASLSIRYLRHPNKTTGERKITSARKQKHNHRKANLTKTCANSSVAVPHSPNGEHSATLLDTGVHEENLPVTRIAKSVGDQFSADAGSDTSAIAAALDSLFDVLKPNPYRPSTSTSAQLSTSEESSLLSQEQASQVYKVVITRIC
ncbi:hypothetical protein ZHAS_00019280 [Anopheles sinensis]|uniref:ZAD domain-containing protein n=1 Tax=Anopheles sinensis TaxID=74873 RepID=A0A084WLZ4_ANOSI|nr:hypothetical protein ZHAS_00019280 [Anopheles sinensis]